MYAKLALPAAALIQLASAQILAGEASTVSSEKWLSVIESANYTDTQEVAGRDLSEAYPGKEQDGWKLRFAVKDAVAGTDEKPVAGGAISLTGPGGDGDFDESWHLCLHVFPVRVASAGGGAWSTDFDGTCSGTVAGECLDDMKKNALSNFGTDCKTWELTPSCQRDISDNTNSEAVGISSKNHKDFIGNETSFYREVFSGDSMAAALEPRAVVTVWGRKADTGDDPTIQVTCLRPDTVESGSTDPAEPAEGGARGGVAAFASWAVLSAAVAFQMLL